MDINDISLPYLVEGEILKVNEVPQEGDSASMVPSAGFSIGGTKTVPVRPIVSYTCKVTLANGAVIVLPRVVDTTPFGGIDDYVQLRHRASKDESSAKIASADDLGAQIGDRVLIAFINGHIFRPVIVSCMQHPLQTSRFEEGVGPDIKPQMYWRYLGLSKVIDEDGQFFITHFGAPTIKYIGSKSLGGAAAEVLGNMSALSTPSGYEGYDEGDETLDENKNKAVVPQNYRFKTTQEFLKDGMWRVRDSIGQNFVLDPKASKILITNMGMSSTKPLDAGLAGALGGVLGGGAEEAELIRLDAKEKSITINSRKLTTIISGDERKDNTIGDYTHKIGGDETRTVSGDQTETIDGSLTRTVKSDLEDTISGDVTWTIKGDLDQTVKGALTITVSDAVDWTAKDAFTLTITSDCKLDTKGDLTMSAASNITIENSKGAGMKVSGTTAEFGTKAVGIFAAMSDALEQIGALIDTITQATFPSGTGPTGPAINTADFIQLKAKFSTLKGKIDSSKGSL